MFMDDWNSIVKDYTTARNDIIFFTIDGTKVHELRRRYKVPGFPSFIYIEPNTKGKKAHNFERQRSKEALVDWMDHLLAKNYS